MQRSWMIQVAWRKYYLYTRINAASCEYRYLIDSEFKKIRRVQCISPYAFTKASDVYCTCVCVNPSDGGRPTKTSTCRKWLSTKKKPTINGDMRVCESLQCIVAEESGKYDVPERHWHSCHFIVTGNNNGSDSGKIIRPTYLSLANETHRQWAG